VLTLKAKGIEDAAALLGGMGAWKEAKLPTEGESVKPEAEKK
jgi:3-mercaptopyruvate sulfurtransferase SseA